MRKMDEWEASENKLLKIVRKKLKTLFPDNNPIAVEEEIHAEAVNLSSPLVSMVLDFNKGRYQYVSENIKEVIGYPASHFLEGGYEREITRMTQQHQEMFLQELLPTMIEWFEEMVAMRKKILNLKVSFYVNLIHKEGHLVPTLHVLKPLAISENGFPCLIGKYMAEHSHLEKNLSPQLILECQDKSGVFIPLRRQMFGPLDRTRAVLSDREKEIVALVKQGRRSREIADLLCLSVHTVNNHKRNITKKCKVSNFHQLDIK